MANNTTITPEQAKQLTQSGMLNEQTASSLFPSTSDNQLATEQAQQDVAASQAALAQARASLASNTRQGVLLSSGDPAQDEAEAVKEAERLREIRQLRQQQVDKQATQNIEEKKALAEEQLRRLKENKAKALALNIRTPEIDAKIQKLEQESMAANVANESSNINDIQVPVQDNLQDPNRNLARIKAEDSLDLQEKTQQVKNTILDKMAAVQGEIGAIESNRNQLFQEQKKVFDDIQELKKQAKETQVDPIWSEGNTGNQILAALAIGLGAYRAELTGSNVNRGLEMVNNIIDRQIQQKQTSFKNQLALKSALLEKTSIQLRTLDSQTASKEKKMQILNMQEQLKQAQAQIDQQLMMQQRQQSLQRIAQSDKVTPEQKELARQELMASLPEKDKAMAINLGDQGGVQIIRGTADEAKNLRQSVADSKTINRDLVELEKLVDRVSLGEKLLGKVGIETQEYRATEQLTNSIVGKLRLEILGPGVMTPAERDLVKSIIGNPNKLATTDEIEKEMLRRLRHKISQGTRDRLQNSGVILPPSKNEIELKKLERQAKKDNVKFDRPKAINFLIDKGLWKEDQF